MSDAKAGVVQKQAEFVDELAPSKCAVALQIARDTVEKWLNLSNEDLDVVDVTLATIVANHANGDPVWILLVAPPSSAKTEIIRATKGIKAVHSLSSLTSKTLISGMKGGDIKNSLLFRLQEDGCRLIALKDFTTILSSHPNDKAEVLSQLREIYDGHFTKEFGTGKSLCWQGRLGLLAGCTPVIEKHHSVMGELGDRFMIKRLHPSERLYTARRSLDASGHEATMREEISSAFQSVVRLADPGLVSTVSATEDLKCKVAEMADIVTRLRSHVSRDGYTKALDYLPEPEGPARFAKALFQFGKALTVIRGRTDLSHSEISLLYQISLDSIPQMRVRIVHALYKILLSNDQIRGNEWKDTSDVARMAGIPKTTAKMLLEDLTLLKTCEHCSDTDEDQDVSEGAAPGKDKKPYGWRMTESTFSNLVSTGLGEMLIQRFSTEIGG